MGSLWIPYVIFRNTDADEAVKVDDDTMTLVSVTREGDFVSSGPTCVSFFLVAELSSGQD